MTIVSIIVNILKDAVKKAFIWFHKKLTQLENFILKKLDKWGQKAQKKLNERLK